MIKYVLFLFLIESVEQLGKFNLICHITKILAVRNSFFQHKEEILLLNIKCVFSMKCSHTKILKLLF